jgi:thiol-disulfide isomerase/thioredoxin
MKKIKISLKGLLILTFISLCLFNSCMLEEDTYEDRVSKCFEAAEKIEIDIEGKKGFGILGNSEPSCILGVPLPEFEMVNMDNKRISTKDLKGKVNIINFWSKGCAPCVAKIPSLNTLVVKYKNKEVNFLAISKDSTNEVVNFLKKHSFDFTIIPNGNDLYRKKFQLMWGMPFTIITDKKNVIIGAISAKKDSSDYMINQIESILAGQGL